MPPARILAGIPLILLLALAGPLRATSTCPAQAEATGLACIATDQGWFYAQDRTAAAGLAEDARQAALVFERHFARPAPPGAVVAAGSAAPLSAGMKAALDEAGAHWQLPWIDAAERQALQRGALARQLRAARPEAGDAEISAMLESALARQPRAEGTDASALRHEIGHMLLIAAFWPDRGADGGAHYGGPAPDWLDETAAVLMESEEMTASRRRMLASAAAEGRIDPLERFFSRQHPLAGSDAVAGIRDEAGTAGTGSVIRVISGEAAQRLSAGSAWFYGQARGMADFLLERSADPAVFGHIAAFIAAGGDMPDWLQAHGAGHGLAPSMDALQADWERWLSAQRTQAVQD